MKRETKSESPAGKKFLKIDFLKVEKFSVGIHPAIATLRMFHVEHSGKSYGGVTRILMLTSGTSSAIIFLSVGNNPRRVNERTYSERNEKTDERTNHGRGRRANVGKGQ